MRKPVALDGLDLALIEALLADGRASNRAIAQQLTVSEGAIRSRLRRLNEQGVLQVRAQLDPRAGGLGVVAQVLLQVRPDRLEAVMRALLEFDDVDFAATALGRWNVVLGVVLPVQPDLVTFVAEKLRSLDGVVQSQTAVVTESVKIDTRWAKLRPG